MLNKITHILLDAARMEGEMEEAKKLNPAYDSLYRGRSEEELADVAPYIFSFQQSKSFVSWYMEKGWGNAWGVLVKSAYPTEELFKHFRKFLIVTTEDAQELYFRFYDPRVLRIFLPTCDKQQLADFFGPVDYFLLEDEYPHTVVRYWLENGQLREAKMPLTDIYSEAAREVITQSTSSSERPAQPANSEVDIVIPQRRKSFSSDAQPGSMPLPSDENENSSKVKDIIPEKKKPKWTMFDD